ncbi:hypothetical protein V8C34DRAFT_299601 [Trichoderma compactum]
MRASLDSMLSIHLVLLSLANAKGINEAASSLHTVFTGQDGMTRSNWEQGSSTGCGRADLNRFRARVVQHSAL